METQLKFVLLLSLKEIALRKITILLCSNADIVAFFCKSLMSRLPTCENKELLEVIEGLELPASLKKQVIDYVPAIGFELRRWIRISKILLFSPYQMSLIDPSKLCWTAAGAINERKTAERIVTWSLLHFRQRYRIACFYCLENYILPLWEVLPEEHKELCRIRIGRPDLEYFWSHIPNGDQSELDFLWRESNRNMTSINQWAFEELACESNQTSCEYFYQRLTPEEKEASLMRAAHSVLGDPEELCFVTSESSSDVLCYLLSIMTPEQQMEIVKARPVEVLLCFLDWKRQHLLPENAGLIWTYITPGSYERLMSMMDLIIERSDHYVPKLIREFLKHSPIDFRKYFLNEEASKSPAWRFLSSFFLWKDPESIRSIISCLDAAERVKLVFSNCILHLLYQNLSMDRWQLVKICLQEAALSKEDKERLKKNFEQFIDKRVGVDENFRRLFEFLNENDDARKGQKRKLESCSTE